MNKETGINLQSILAAVLLSVITLGVFFLLQDFGPESAVRRFHQAAAADDYRELARVTVQPLNTEKVQFLRTTVKNLVNGSQIRLGRVKRTPGKVIAEFRYYQPGGVYVILWTVNRTPSGWAVDANATVETTRQFLGL